MQPKIGRYYKHINTSQIFSCVKIKQSQSQDEDDVIIMLKPLDMGKVNWAYKDFCDFFEEQPGWDLKYGQ